MAPSIIMNILNYLTKKSNDSSCPLWFSLEVTDLCFKFFFQQVPFKKDCPFYYFSSKLGLLLMLSHQVGILWH